MIRGLRGAAQAEANEKTAVLKVTSELMAALIHANSLEPDKIAAVFFTVTPDLTAAFPAEIRQQIGWYHVPFLCSQEIPVQGAMERIIRVLILFETNSKQEELRHQYLGASAALRPDLSKKPKNDE